MSRLVIDISELDVIRGNTAPIRCRVIAQYIDIELINNSDYFAKMIIKNIADFEKDNDVRHAIFMGEDVYSVAFLKDEKLQKGDALDLYIALWNNDITDASFWELLDVHKTTVNEIHALRDFIRTPEGINFLQLSAV
ncbi:hypothetical protein KAFR_0C06340 [Kazachstania africana CBS 2517]|uniref:Telomeric single stranded DNA binding POT1/Cdc13 domain-containing protein n=1 Tax=Kazachstania africana (strain ATCC 22294 / BCRC 22015 / CBS 2517 / CECT 1963 / NBRC 1671 / NRRL Y-8276) TaxID=1071382 RepID=H2ATD0_KAZAF|nr:hypothetical protein KAFR_0C06340 [Kazachstania africana CBS 2517]CCF57630.1 hypothetical protein KAFR_0C06340 [Kazachstania africana CBS 2517]